MISNRMAIVVEFATGGKDDPANKVHKRKPFFVNSGHPETVRQYHLYRAFGITSKYKLQCAKVLLILAAVALGAAGMWADYHANGKEPPVQQRAGRWAILASSWNSKASPDVPHPLIHAGSLQPEDVYAEERGERWRPERWLEATGECFVLCIGVSWLVTSVFNPGGERDFVKSIVGFDSPPARYVAMPLLVCQAVLAARNISAWAGVAAAVAAPVLFSVQRGWVGGRRQAARTVQVAGRAVSIIVLILCAAATWFVARTVLNRLAHALSGNSLPATLVELVGGEATFAVKGKRSDALHKVWFRLDSKESACGCRAFLQEGACGHCDAAAQAAVMMGLVRSDQAASAPEGGRPAELGSRAIAKGLAALPTQECFSGLAAKSREISCLSGLLNRGGSSSGAPAATSTALSVPAPAAATAAQGPRRMKTPRAEPTSRGGQEVAYLAGDAYIAAGLSALASAKSRSSVMLRAYSFDAPAVLEALEAACARGASCSLIADASQCSKTKLQWQSLKRVATAGVSVRLATGRSVRDAYVSDGRGPKGEKGRFLLSMPQRAGKPGLTSSPAFVLVQLSNSAVITRSIGKQVWMACFPMLLVITAEFDSWTSTKAFKVQGFIMWAMIAGNVLEAEEVERLGWRTGTRIWFGLFTFHTLALPAVGVIDVLNFHPVHGSVKTGADQLLITGCMDFTEEAQELKGLWGFLASKRRILSECFYQVETKMQVDFSATTFGAVQAMDFAQATANSEHLGPPLRGAAMADGPVMLVTGANQARTVSVFEESGNARYLGARSQERGEAALEELKAKGLRPELAIVDVASPESVQKCAEMLQERHGGADLVIHNAAARMTPEKTPPEYVREIY
ncbi:Carbonyl reductase [NADPH] 1 [Symbiodinium microadriaticum]|uniref:Carbonyl reductase [NADPH] 1 n=1 Tax=Symbiodinium microadriaticum TaxID=2951 RepID=A0A1Q9ERS9_SYMMI|nr:Carbonyl reductase [NADPH] 1 [Symbiodinium microadriaticum]